MTAISPAEYEARIAALERQCATLAAQVDGMRPVVTAAQGYGGCDQYGWDKTAARRVLIETVSAYDAAMAALTREAG